MNLGASIANCEDLLQSNEMQRTGPIVSRVSTIFASVRRKGDTDVVVAIQIRKKRRNVSLDYALSLRITSQNCVDRITMCSANEKGMKLDAQSALDHILSHPKLENTPIWLYGQSIGGAVSIFLASQNARRVSFHFLLFPHRLSKVVIDSCDQTGSRTCH